MKKILSYSLSIFALALIVFVSCKSKNDSSAITPTYKSDAGGGNPYYDPTNVTTTGTIATTGSQQSSSMSNVGVGAEWLSSGCSGSNVISITNSNTGTIFTITFMSAPTAGVYTFVPTQGQLGPGKAYMTVYSPTNQTPGTTWYSAGGTCTVTINASAITAAFSGIPCYQATGGFYSVTVSGQVGCL